VTRRKKSTPATKTEPQVKPKLTSEEGAELRRRMYAFSRAAKVSEIKVTTHQRCKALLDATAGKPRSEQQGAFAEIMAILVEATAALKRLEEGKTNG
jgi:hypothetical protein